MAGGGEVRWGVLIIWTMVDAVYWFEEKIETQAIKEGIENGEHQSSGGGGGGMGEPTWGDRSGLSDLSPAGAECNTFQGETLVVRAWESAQFAEKADLG